VGFQSFSAAAARKGRLAKGRQQVDVLKLLIFSDSIT
jgi:hypothetical protein